eukprot:758279-Prorocentrum_minimum.AAC.1
MAGNVGTFYTWMRPLPLDQVAIIKDGFFENWRGDPALSPYSGLNSFYALETGQGPTAVDMLGLNPSAVITGAAPF